MNIKASPVTVEKPSAEKLLHPASRNFVRYCEDLRQREIELLKIQDGLLTAHTATEWSNAGTSRFCIDGSLAAPLNFAITTTSGGGNARFGRQFDPFAEFFTGGIDDVRITTTHSRKQSRCTS